MGHMIRDWGGGRDFMCNLVEGLSYAQESSELYIILPPENTLWLWKMAVISSFDTVTQGKGLGPAIKQMTSSYKKGISLNRNEELLRQINSINGNVSLIKIGKVDSSMIKPIMKKHLDIIFPVIHSLGKSFPIPWMGYIPDIQHIELPNNFSEEVKLRRDEEHKSILADSVSVMVHSEKVKNDLERYYDTRKTKIFPIPFCPGPPKGWFDDDQIASVRTKYNIRGRYFLISNQFWVHKDHGTAFEALKAMFDDSPDLRTIDLVCTGLTNDPRFPNHFEKLKDKILKLGLKNSVHFLGYISKMDQMALMNGSIGLIQPSLYEGSPGGYSVYDAVKYGVPVIASDIPVNKEIDSDRVMFFKAGSGADLATQMAKLAGVQSEHRSMEDLVVEGNRRQATLSSSLDQMIRYTIEANRS